MTPKWPPKFGPLLNSFFFGQNLIRIWFLAIFGHFWPKSTPPKTDPPKNPGKWPFWRKPGFSSMIWTAKRGGGWGFTQGPPKKAIFGHFWPFLAILAIFGHFWPFFDFSPQNSPFLIIFWPQKWTHPPTRPPWPDFLYLIIGLLGRKFGICAENEDFSAPPQVREKCEWIWPQSLLLPQNI